MKWIVLPIALLSISAAAQDGLGGMLPPAPSPPADAVDPVGDAATGLVAEVEDDLSDKDAMLMRVETKACITTLHAATHRWTLDWRTIERVIPGDTFVFVAGPDVKLAIVGDASKPDQARKLSALLMAMRAMQGRCNKR